MIIGYDWSREHLKSFSSLPPNGSKNEINQAIRTFVAFVDSDIHLINFFKLVKLSGGEIVFSSSTSVLRIVKRNKYYLITKNYMIPFTIQSVNPDFLIIMFSILKK